MTPMSATAREAAHCRASIIQRHVFSTMVAIRNRKRVVARYNLVLVQRNFVEA
jgi:hypothetical protein